MLIYPQRYKFFVACLYVSVLFLDRMDLTIVNSAIPSFAREFGVPITHTEWIVTAFILALATVMPLSGWASQRFGCKNIFLGALALFTLGSALSAYAWDLPSLITFRALQGAAGGMLVPVGMTMVYRVFPTTEFPKLASYTLMPTLVAPAIAPTIGGFFVEYLNWRWIFLINIPIGLGAFFLTWFFLKSQPEENKKSPLDVWGVLLVGGALVSFLITLSDLGDYGFLHVRSVLGICFTIGLFFLCYVREKYFEFPLINFDFFKNKLFLQANLLQISLQICYFGSLFLVILYLQVYLGLSPLVSGLIFLVQPVFTIAILPITAKIFKHIGPKTPMLAGFLGLGLSNLLILFISPGMNFLTLTALALFAFRGLSIGLVNSPIQALSMLDIPRADTPQASTIFNIGRQIAISTGVALSSALFASSSRWSGLTENVSDAAGMVANVPHPELFFPFVIAFGAVALIALVGAGLTLRIDNLKIRDKVRG